MLKIVFNVSARNQADVIEDERRNLNSLHLYGVKAVEMKCKMETMCCNAGKSNFHGVN